MELQIQLYVAAGLSAFAIGAGAFVRERGRMRNRLFASFCFALMLWNLAKAAELGGLSAPLPWHFLFLLGACAAVPLGLHFTLLVAGPSGQSSNRALAWAYAVCAALWISSMTPAYSHQPAWSVAALVLLASVLAVGVRVLVQHTRTLPHGVHRNSSRLMLVAAAIGALGSLSDLLPRGSAAILKIGPAAVIVFLLVMCGVLLRHRFLDIETFLTQVLAVVVAALAATLILHGVIRLAGERIFPLFLVVLLLIALGGPVWRTLLSGLRSLLGAGDPVAQALVTISGELSRALDPGALWKALGNGLRDLPGSLRVSIHLHTAPGTAFRTVFQSGPRPTVSAVAAADPLPRLLERETTPLTRISLEVDAAETRGERQEQAAAALAQLRALDWEIVVPMHRGRVLAGWIAIDGERLRNYPWPELAAAFQAIGNQALATLDRIEAMAASRRREALAAVGELAAGLAHEVRNPLGAIRGAAQVLTAGADGSHHEEMLQVIDEETARLGCVVEDFLDYARPAPLRREVVDVVDLVRRVFRSADAAGMDLRTDVRLSEGTGQVIGDPDQLQRAFANLTRNASEAAGRGGLLHVDVGRDGAGRVTIRFEDNGPGIPPEQLVRLFQPFHTTKPGGTGLGLALVHRVAEAHGGEVSVHEPTGGGAGFTLRLLAAPEAQ